LLDGAAVVGHLAAYRGVVCGWCDGFLEGVLSLSSPSPSIGLCSLSLLACVRM
jgi:hypothetical protein